MSAKQPANKRSGLGGNPLSTSLFTKTTDIETPQPLVEPVHVEEASPQTTTKNLEPINKNLENRFLEDIEDGSKESIGLQVTTEINDWLDEIVKVGRRKHGRKIPKQVWIQAGVELLRAMPIDWTEIKDLDDLRNKLSDLVMASKKEQ